MDEAEKYQQRVQAIAEKRRQQEEEERLRREVEEEWLKLAQRKRKSLRDQWLMDVANAAATDGPEPPAPLWPPAQRAEGQDNESAEEGEQNAMEEEEEEDEDERTVQDGRQTNSTENNVSTEDNTDENESQGEVEETAVPSSTFLPMQNGGEDRSVLGRLEVRVERDLRTGATVVKSVAPLPPGDPPGVTPMETVVFDDGRKCVRAVSGGPSGAQSEASAEDLDRVLNTLDEVGVPVLLEARGLVAPSVEGLGGREEAEVEEEELEEEEEEEEDTEEETLDPKEDSVNMREESVGDADGVWEKGESADEKVIDTEEEEEEEEEEEAFRPEEGLDPITLTFLGFSQAASEPGQGNEDDGSLVRVERVLIHEYSDEDEEDEEGWEGEEHHQYHQLASPDMDNSHASTSAVVGTEGAETEGELGRGEGAVEKESLDDVFQDVTLDDAQTSAAQEPESQPPALTSSGEPSRAEGVGSPKHKTCQCCSVM
ncbi:nucleolin-like [Sardina pilchardus]|uniref:nucleolin-like n=1 Tax=Sardina pilchardus TaxID=27697 RepID=UPI002E0D82FD